ncbi:phage terminase small subunit P27 family [Rhodococcus sp. D2-41]|uniref:phage terminase small subunit P27 family n=1 Tax=Speluncibacter jeojiensis TaxID=2710754 RepID=UPI00241014F3|nr:phage terminase small subunit P27 family [Rhodococcus sp. D2-41]MDG3012388.1 phage terminase small subunit P27 family [Rhodococcus sp. D2-41]
MPKRNGPPARPNHLKILEGAPESRINRNEPTPARADEIKPPPGMTAKARAIWRKLAPDLIDKGVLTSWDVYTFAMYCNAVADYEAVRKAMGTNYVVPGSMNQDVRSPYWNQMVNAAALADKFGSQFGLSPSDRARLVIAGDDAPRELGAERLLS